MGVTKHVRVTSEKIKDAALATVDYGNATITEAKFSEHLEHGTVTGVTATGRYKVFTTAFGGAPDVVFTEITGSLAARLMGTPVAGSFGAKLTAAGTQDLMFQAWGAR
jgi:hypothetical protein